jgi:hypothetical protein
LLTLKMKEGRESKGREKGKKKGRKKRKEAQTD